MTENEVKHANDLLRLLQWAKRVREDLSHAAAFHDGQMRFCPEVHRMQELMQDDDWIGINSVIVDRLARRIEQFEADLAALGVEVISEGSMSAEAAAE